MLFITETVKIEEVNNLNNFFSNVNNEFNTLDTVSEEKAVEEAKESPVAIYLNSLVCGQYQKAIEDIENTVVGNKLKRKRTLQQVMTESFFYGANRFGKNFIA